MSVYNKIDLQSILLLVQKLPDFCQLKTNNRFSFTDSYPILKITNKYPSWGSEFYIRIDARDFTFRNYSTTYTLPRPLLKGSFLEKLHQLFPPEIFVYLDECLEKFQWNITWNNKSFVIRGQDQIPIYGMQECNLNRLRVFIRSQHVHTVFFRSECL